MALDRADAIQHGPWTTVRYDKPVEACGPNELSDMENTRIGQGGYVEPRKGTLSYGSESALAGTPTVTMAAQFNSNATTEHEVIVAGAAIYKYSSGWSAITGSVTVTAGDDNTWEWVDANGTLCAVNGVDTLGFKWTGTGNAADLTVSSRFTVPAHIAWFDNRLWCGNVSGATGELWYSNTADIATWGATSFFKFGGRITGLLATQNALVVHTTDGIYTLIPTGNASNPYIPNKRTIKFALDGRGIAALPNDVQLMILEDGVYQWSGGAELEKISYYLDDGYWANLNQARLHQAFALYWADQNEVWFALPYGTSQTNMNHIMVYNRRTGGWHGPYKGWERNCAAVIDNKPHLGDFGGILWDHDAGDDDNGSAIASSFTTGGVGPYGSDVRVRWLQARHYYDGKGNWTVTATQQGTDLVGTTETLSMKGVGFTLDTDSLDDPSITLNEVRPLSQDAPLAGYGPHSSMKISHNAADQDYRFRSITLRFKGLGRFSKPKPEDA